MAATATVDTNAVANPEEHSVTLTHHDKLIYFSIFYLFEFFATEPEQLPTKQQKPTLMQVL
jgi:hypothetical protein